MPGTSVIAQTLVVNRARTLCGLPSCPQLAALLAVQPKPCGTVRLSAVQDVAIPANDGPFAGFKMLNQCVTPSPPASEIVSETVVIQSACRFHIPGVENANCMVAAHIRNI